MPAVEETVEERPRNPTPTSAATSLPDSGHGGAIPKRSIRKRRPERRGSEGQGAGEYGSNSPLPVAQSLHVLPPLIRIDEGTDNQLLAAGSSTFSGQKEESSSPHSSTSGSENTALLLMAMSGYEGQGPSELSEQPSSELVQRIPSTRRQNAELRFTSRSTLLSSTHSPLLNPHTYPINKQITERKNQLH